MLSCLNDFKLRNQYVSVLFLLGIRDWDHFADDGTSTSKCKIWSDPDTIHLSHLFHGLMWKAWEGDVLLFFYPRLLLTVFIRGITILQIHSSVKASIYEGVGVLNVKKNLIKNLIRNAFEHALSVFETWMTHTLYCLWMFCIQRTRTAADSQLTLHL